MIQRFRDSDLLSKLYEVFYDRDNEPTGSIFRGIISLCFALTGLLIATLFYPLLPPILFGIVAGVFSLSFGSFIQVSKLSNRRWDHYDLSKNWSKYSQHSADRDRADKYFALSKQDRKEFPSNINELLKADMAPEQKEELREEFDATYNALIKNIEERQRITYINDARVEDAIWNMRANREALDIENNAFREIRYMD